MGVGGGSGRWERVNSRGWSVSGSGRGEEVVEMVEVEERVVVRDEVGDGQFGKSKWS